MAGLPGQMRKLKPGEDQGCCETEGHEDRPATYEIQGETDSFGCEYSYVCEECAQANDGSWYTGTCGSCGARNVKLYGYRDPDEGSSGPVYAACQSCKSKEMRRQTEDALKELEYLDSLEHRYS